jgi:hypothetical protein
VSQEWRKQRKEELYDLSCSQYTIRVMKPRRTRWLCHVAHMEEKKNKYKILVGKP